MLFLWMLKNNVKGETETFEKFGKSKIFKMFKKKKYLMLTNAVFVNKKYNTNAVFFFIWIYFYI